MRAQNTIRRMPAAAPVAAVLAVAVAVGCKSMGRLPNAPLRAEGPVATPEAGGAPAAASPPASGLAEMAAALLPGAERVRVVRRADQDLILGYGPGDDVPRMAASLCRVGDAKGSLLLGVGVERTGAGARITRVVTRSPEGTLPGLARYREEEGAFLEHFRDRPVGDLRGVDCVSGATALSETIRDVASEEAARLVSLLADQTTLRAIEAASVALDSEVAPPSAAAPPIESVESTGHGAALGPPAGLGRGPGRTEVPDPPAATTALYVEMFLFAAAVGIVIARSGRRR